MDYIVRFTYRAPANVSDIEDPGHMIVSFIERNGQAQVYRQNFEMNINKDATLDSMLNITPGVKDGEFKEINTSDISGPGDHIYTREISVSASVFDQLTDLSNDLAESEEANDWFIFGDSCLSYANTVYKLAGQAGNVLDLFSAVPISDRGLLFLGHGGPLQAGLAAALAGILAASFFTPPVFIMSVLLGASLGVPLYAVLDPLVLDLDADGIELSALQGSTIHFDLDGDGFAERTGWVSPDDGILVLDRNGNGVVDGASELLGSRIQDGFAVLESLDSNDDGKIDALDADFSKLKVWRDLNQNGVSDQGEVQSLGASGIASLNLTTTEVSGTNAGHGIGFQAEYVKSDGSVGIAQTIYFQTDRQDTRQDNLAIDISKAEARRGEIAVNIGRFEQLDEVYQSDIERLEAIDEAGFLLAVGGDKPCPLCGALPREQRHTHGLDEIADAREAANSEVEKIKRQRVDLRATIDQLDTEGASNATGLDGLYGQTFTGDPASGRAGLFHKRS